MKRGNFVEARCHFEKLLLDEPKNISALVNLGESQVRLGDNNSAVETFLTALSVDKNNRAVLYNLAVNVKKSKFMRRMTN